MADRQERARLTRDLRAAFARPKRRPGRPSNAELAAEEAEARRIATRAVLAQRGYLHPDDAEAALREARDAAPLTSRLGDLPDFDREPDLSGVVPSRTLRDP